MHQQDVLDIHTKNQRNDPSGVPPLTKDGSIIAVVDDYAKGNELNDYFTSVFTKENSY